MSSSTHCWKANPASMFSHRALVIRSARASSSVAKAMWTCKQCTASTSSTLSICASCSEPRGGAQSMDATDSGSRRSGFMMGQVNSTVPAKRKSMVEGKPVIVGLRIHPVPTRLRVCSSARNQTAAGESEQVSWRSNNATPNRN